SCEDLLCCSDRLCCVLLCSDAHNERKQQNTVQKPAEKMLLYNINYRATYPVGATDGAKSYSNSEHIPDKRYESRTTDTSTELIIRKLTLADTALYYCAVDTQ
uniref:Immunoglobulin V-set domain-containing protein n=1 Tax=Oryzias latipes TaxID=8090 RepID=A0A3P9MDQ8_ORYLA